MAIVQVKTFLDIQDAVLRRGKIEDTTKNRTDIKEYINTFYQELAREEHYRWSGDTQPLKLQGKYTTGTVAITNGEYALVGTGTAWTEVAHRFAKLRIGSHPQVFTVLNVFSGTTLTLDQPYTGATVTAATHTIYKDTYGLFPDCQDVRRLRLPGLISQRQPRPVGIEKIDRMRDMYPFREGTPRGYSVFGKAHFEGVTWADFLINHNYWSEDFDDRPQANALHIWPGVQTEDRVSLVRFSRTPEALGADTDEPWIPVEDRAVLVWGVLKERFLVNRDVPTRREWKKEYDDRKKKMANDIEETDEELTLQVDASQYSRGRQFFSNEDEILLGNL